MKFSSTDRRSETVSLIRNKKKYFIDRNKCIIKNRVLSCFQTRSKVCKQAGREMDVVWPDQWEACNEKYLLFVTGGKENHKLNRT